MASPMVRGLFGSACELLVLGTGGLYFLKKANEIQTNKTESKEAKLPSIIQKGNDPDLNKVDNEKNRNYSKGKQYPNIIEFINKSPLRKKDS